MEDLVPFEIAKKLKEKGLREKCISHFQAGAKKLYQSQQPRCYNYRDNCYDAPTISQVLQCLRKEHKMYVCPLMCSEYEVGYMKLRKYTFWSFRIINIDDASSVCDDLSVVFTKPFESFEQASLAGIEYVLDNLI